MRVRYLFKFVGFGKYEVITEEIKEPRPNGFYWVKSDGRWTIAEYYNSQWIFLGDIGLMNDSDFEKINEDRIKERRYN